jgi:hypothetical protein
VLDTKQDYQGRQASLYIGTNYKNIIPKNGTIKLKKYTVVLQNTFGI